jgi:hypothetical protein
MVGDGARRFARPAKMPSLHVAWMDKVADALAGRPVPPISLSRQ